MNDINLVELRQYTLHGGQRDRLVTLFEREFVATQAAVGIEVLGRFRDLDDPDRFVWMRGFADPVSRGEDLARFYTGPAWAKFRAEANATMLDSDNVLLMRPLGSAAGVADELRVERGVLRATIHQLGDVAPEAFARFWQEALEPRMRASGFTPFRPLVSANVENHFPRLPVRGDPVFAWWLRFADEQQERDFAMWWSRLSGWRDGIDAALLPATMRKPEILRLQPV